MLRHIRKATEFIEIQTNRRFDRYIKTERINIRNVVDGCLYPDGDLVEVTSVTNGDGTDLPLSAFELIEQPLTGGVYGLDLVHYSYSWDVDVNRRQSYVSVAGEWGYGGRWELQGTAGDDYAEGVTSIAISDYSHIDQWTLLKIGDEFLLVIVDPGSSPSSLTVQRGANGSTAAAISTDDPVYRFVADPLVEALTIRIVQFINALDENPTTTRLRVNQQEIQLELSRMPPDILEDVKLLRRRPGIRAIGGS
jgi:hypothetical protein